MTKMVESGLKSFFGLVWEDVAGYLRVYEYLKLRLRGHVGNAKKVPTPASFWHSLLGERFAGSERPAYVPLRDGDVVRMKNLFLTEWIPKLPGRIWTSEGQAEIAKGQKDISRYLEIESKMYPVLGLGGKQSVLSGGYGSIRLRRLPSRNEDRFMMLGLVDESHWNSDFSIPVLVSRAVYRKFQEHAEHGAPWVKKLEATLVVGEDPPLTQVIPRAIGAELSEATEETLRYRPSLPRCYLYLQSPLSLDLAYNDSHPSATAWTMFRRRAAASAGSEPSFGYTYTPFEPDNPESVDEAVEFINWYVREHGGTTIQTDFDGQVPRLEAAIPISVDPLRSRKPAVRRLVTGLDRWTQSSLRRLRRR